MFLRKQEQAALRALSAEGAYKDALQMLEGFCLDPAQEPRVAAFFYVLGLAVQDPEPYREFLDSVEDWTDLFTTLGERDRVPTRTHRPAPRPWSGPRAASSSRP